MPKFDWLKIAREIGVVLGFVSIFLVWIVSKTLTDIEIPLARYIDPHSIWSLLQVWPMMLAPIGGLLFLSGCIILLFTRWGVIAQIIGLLAFVGFYLWWNTLVPSDLGIGFYVGSLSAAIIVATVLIERRMGTPNEVIST